LKGKDLAITRHKKNKRLLEGTDVNAENRTVVDRDIKTL